MTQQLMSELARFLSHDFFSYFEPWILFINVMTRENEDKAMDASFGSHTSVISERVKTRHPCLRVVLLLILLAGLTSATTISPAATSPRSSVFYFIQVTVNVRGQRKTETEVKSWLENALQTNLQSCASAVDGNTTSFPVSVTVIPPTTLQDSRATAQTQNNPASTGIPASTRRAQTRIVSRDPTTQEKPTIARTRVVATTKKSQTSATARGQATTNGRQTIQAATPAQTRKQTTVQTRSTNSRGLTVAVTGDVIEEDSTGNSNNGNSNNGNSGNSNNGRNRREIRWERDTSIQSRNTPGLFQGVEVSCVEKTLIRNTDCTLTLRLSQQVGPCCILQTLCAASRASSNIFAVGTRANILNVPSDVCSVDSPEDKVCIYDGQTGASCDLSTSAYGPPPCTPVNATTQHNCTCQGYCDQPVAFYTFKISMEPPATSQTALSVISRLQTFCTPTNSSCEWANQYQEAIADCSGTATNPEQCRLVLRFSSTVPICSLSEALVVLFQTEDSMAFDGQVKRAAVCSQNGSDLTDLELTWYRADITPERFCSLMQGPFPFSNVDCLTTTAAVLQLSQQCDVTTTTTVSPTLNATTLSANATGNATTPALSKEGQANALLELAQDAANLNAAQVSALVAALEKLLDGPNVSLALGNISVQIVSSLLDASLEAVAQSSNRINGITETVGLKLVPLDPSQTLLSQSVALAVRTNDGTDFQETSFTVADPKNVEISGSRARRRPRASSIAQASVTLPSTLTQNLTAEEQQLVSRVQFNFYQKNTTFQDASLGRRRMNSGVVSASVANLSISGLQDEVVIRLRNIEPIPANYESLCVFWDQSLNNGSGGWNQNGCSVRNVTDNETVCGCNHLTSFSILLNLSRLPVTSRLQATILTFITYIGCGVSAIFLAVTLLTYLSFGKLRKDIPSKILIQLCLALLLLNLVFLVDAWLALYVDAVGLCISTAWFLHYFLLVVFTWMGLEAVHMYLALVKVFNTYVSHYMVRFSVAGWGVPMLVVIIVIAIDKDNYGLVSYGRFDDGTSDSFCWIRNDIAFYVAVVAYFCVIFVFNFIMFLVVLVQLCRIKRQNPHNLQHRTTLQDVRSVTGITVLLGLTWGFAFFAWGPVNLPFMYLFAIFNSFQGFFIFIFHCLVKENVRRQWRTYLCCGKMRLAENSDWSRTATQKTARRSSVTRGTSLPSSKVSQSHNSSSSFLVNDGDSRGGVGNPLDDAAIMADENHTADVILNEAHSQYGTHVAS